MIAILLLAGFYVGWNTGSNDAANCIGTSVGSGIISYKRAVLLMSIFAILGATLQGHYVMKTVGQGIVQAELPDLAILVTLFTAGFFVTLSTFLKVPVSTCQAIVGGVLGVGIGYYGYQSEHINYAVLKTILLCWVLSPILIGILSLLIYVVLIYFLRRTRKVPLWNRIISLAAIGSSCYVAYTLGANNVGKAIGPLLNKFPDKGLWLALFGAVATAIGALTFGRGVTETVGKNIAPLDFPGAFAAQFATGFGIHLFTLLGIPVSTSQGIVGGVIGVGLARGIKTVGIKHIIKIVVGWFAAPACTAIFSYLVFTLFKPLLK